MAKNWLRRFMPEPHEVKEHKYLRFLGSLLHQQQLWQMNRRTVPKAVGIGVFCAFMPMPFQMFFAAMLGIMLQANLPLSIGLVWISNPITMPPMFYGAYIIGKWILGSPDIIEPGMHDLSVAIFVDKMNLIWKPFLLGTTVCGIFFGFLSYLIAKWCWAYSLSRRRKRSPL